MKPSIGRMVHYHNDYGKIYAAVITGLGYSYEHVNLYVFPTSELINGATHDDVMLGSEYSTCHVWSWPERV